LQAQRVQVDSHLQSATRLHLDLACVKLDNVEFELNETKVKLNDAYTKLNATETKLETTRKVVEKLDTRKFIWGINKFSEIWRQANMGKRIIRESNPFYTDRIDSCGYKLNLKVAADKLGGTVFLWMFIVVMRGEYDAVLTWPFEKNVRLTVIDQKKDLIRRRNITSHLVTGIDREAFNRPVEQQNEAVMFPEMLTLERLNSSCYIVNDTLFLQVEISPL